MPIRRAKRCITFCINKNSPVAEWQSRVPVSHVSRSATCLGQPRVSVSHVSRSVTCPGQPRVSVSHVSRSATCLGQSRDSVSHVSRSATCLGQPRVSVSHVSRLATCLGQPRVSAVRRLPASVFGLGQSGRGAVFECGAALGVIFVNIRGRAEHTRAGRRTLYDCRYTGPESWTGRRHSWRWAAVGRPVLSAAGGTAGGMTECRLHVARAG